MKNIEISDSTRNWIKIKVHIAFAIISFVLSVFVLNKFNYSNFKIFYLQDIFNPLNPALAETGEWIGFFITKGLLYMYGFHQLYLGVDLFMYELYRGKLEKEKRKSDNGFDDVDY